MSLNFFPRSMYTRKLAAELMQVDKLAQLVAASMKSVLEQTR